MGKIFLKKMGRTQVNKLDEDRPINLIQKTFQVLTSIDITLNYSKSFGLI